MAELKREGARLLDLTTSNPTQTLVRYPHKQIRNAFASVRDFKYHPDPPGMLAAREAVAAYYEAKGNRLSPDQLFLTASTSEAYGMLFKLLCNPGDDILVPTPSYPLFEYLAALESIRVAPFHLQYDGHWYLESDELWRRATERTRAIVIVNPNNPTGSFLKENEAAELCNFARERGLAIISDEVFMDYAFENDRSRVATFVGNEDVPSFSLNGLSKCAGMPQMKLGWIAVNGSAAFRAEAREKLELIGDTYLSVNTPVQNALPALFEIGSAIRADLARCGAKNLETLRTILGNGPAQALRVEGGWSAIVRIPNVQSENAWVTQLLDEYGTIVQPGYFFDMPGEGYLVVSLITPPKIFMEGVEAIRDLTARVTQS